MRIKKSQEDLAEGDMTPMIDMVFQLIAFFMVIINFTEAEQDARIQIPISEMAKPPETPFEEQLTLQLTRDEHVIYAGDEIPMDQMPGVLNRERDLLERQNKQVADATVIIRADGRAKHGVVQQLIKACQDVGFERFALRAEQKKSSKTSL